MLVSSIVSATRDDFSSERFARAFAFLREHDLSSLGEGRHAIDGDAVFANVMSYETVPAAEKHFEAHRRYFDIQCVVSGVERIGVTDLARAVPIGAFDVASDFGLFDVDPEMGEGDAGVTWVVLRSGDFCVVGPEEAHKPGCALDAPVWVRKVVVKVAVE